ncbi:helix-turn-helix transcriptional regulator [Actomonas aquatica]|uniref:YafY family protein n=1 Tax=Actomonas aquatica TaxID=2866162 RepID=A0ABZ1C2P0_9BACT|nr:YafY family protein [Opitutus sp. WL0086]WRQ85804.1 YafY family protein [Opitutus sp. WL0086]
MNRIDRLFAITLLLQSRRVVTGAEIAAHFEVSLRTVYRDLGALSEAGIPVVAEAGVGYSLPRGYFLPPVAFTADEAQALALGAVLLAKFGGQGSGDAAAGALLKIRSILSPQGREEIVRLAKAATVFGAGAAVPGTENLVPCARAVSEQRVLRLDYTTAQAVRSQRDVEPLGVVLYDFHWYLVAWCRLRKAMRSFRLDRVVAMELVAERVPLRPHFDLEQHLKAAFDEEMTRRVQLWFADGFAADRARRELGTSVQQAVKQVGGWEITALVWSESWIARWLLPFGEQARVIAPVELQEAVRREIAALARHHGVMREGQE